MRRVNLVRHMKPFAAASLVSPVVLSWRCASTANSDSAGGVTRGNASGMQVQPLRPPSAFAEKFLLNRIWESHPAGRHVTVYVDSGSIAWIVMDRAGSSANALGEEFVRDMNTALDITEGLVQKKKVQFAVIASAKTTFCVGADLEEVYGITDRDTAAEVSRLGQELFSRIAAEPFAVVAAINGLALGGGFELALACHHRLIASTAKVGLPECLLGLLPGAGGTVRAQRLCGLTKAVQWILSSQQVKASAAKAAGACDAVLPAEQRWAGEERFYELVRRWTAKKLSDAPLRPAQRKPLSWLDVLLERTRLGRRQVAQKSMAMLNKRTKGKYIGQYKALECLLYTAAHTDAEGYAREREGFAELLCSPEAKNMISLYFLDEGMKKSEGKTGIPKDKVPAVHRVGVIGAGVMGSGIAYFFASKNMPVAVRDLQAEAVDKCISRVRSEFSDAVHRRKLPAAVAEKKSALVTGGTSDAVLRNADVIIEATAEVMAVKKKVIEQLESDGVICGSNFFATNTSSLSLTEMQTVSKYPQNIVGMHFFNPVAKMPLVEVIKGKATSAEAAAAIYTLALRTGKKPIIVNDAPGFVVNRILGVYMAEAGRMAIGEHCNPVLIDRAVLDFGMPMGPFRLLDEVGLDIACHVGPVLAGGLHSDRFAVDARINDMAKDGNLGKKNKRGFYTYDDAGKEIGPNQALIHKYIGSDRSGKLSSAEMVDRCMLLMVNEASHILMEKVAASPEDIDIGMVWGAGFPPFRGGLLQYADHRGIPEVVEELTRLQDAKKSDHYKPSPLLVSMARENMRFYTNRPFVPYKERHGYPAVRY